MKIGELAKLTGVSVDTLRFYEEKGLVKAIGRTEAGYRNFSPATVEQMKFIKFAQGLGFSLQEILEVIPYLQEGKLCSFDVRGRLKSKLLALDEQIKQLTSLREELLQTMQLLVCQDEVAVTEKSLINE
jgi:MerR family copper efflux transcriptional regulator